MEIVEDCWDAGRASYRDLSPHGLSLARLDVPMSVPNPIGEPRKAIRAPSPASNVLAKTATYLHCLHLSCSLTAACASSGQHSVVWIQCESHDVVVSLAHLSRLAFHPWHRGRDGKADHRAHWHVRFAKNDGTEASQTLHEYCLVGFVSGLTYPTDIAACTVQPGDLKAIHKTNRQSMKRPDRLLM